MARLPTAENQRGSFANYHNLGLDPTLALIDEVRREGFDVSLLCLKPQDREFDRKLIDSVVARLIDEVDLGVLCSSEKHLTPEEVTVLYSDLFMDIGLESDFIGDHRKKLVDYMTSGKVLTFLLYGTQAFPKVQWVKTAFRDGYCAGELLKNGIHVPSEGELGASVQILFAEGSYESAQL